MQRIKKIMARRNNSKTESPIRVNRSALLAVISSDLHYQISVSSSQHMDERAFFAAHLEDPAVVAPVSGATFRSRFFLTDFYTGLSCWTNGPNPSSSGCSLRQWPLLLFNPIG